MPKPPGDSWLSLASLGELALDVALWIKEAEKFGLLEGNEQTEYGVLEWVRVLGVPRATKRDVIEAVEATKTAYALCNPIEVQRGDFEINLQRGDFEW